MNQADLPGSSRDKTDAELGELLEKIEKNIIASISRGIEITDNFSKECNSSDSTSVANVLPLTEEAKEFPEAVREIRSIREAGETKKVPETEKIAKDIKEPRAIDERFTPGDPSSNPDIKRWEFYNPIVLYKSNWMGARPGGVRLEKGTYQIVYKISAFGAEESGLAIFNENKRVERLLVWVVGIDKSSLINNLEGTQYLAIYNPSILNITDAKGNFNPGSARAVYIVTIFRVNKLPD